MWVCLRLSVGDETTLLYCGLCGSGADARLCFRLDGPPGCGPETMTPEDAHKALCDARAFAESGDFEKALERHEWFHENALACDPGQYGVRLSFALSYWKELADKYPPALASLLALRDSGTAALESGHGGAELIHDVRAINKKLGEGAETIRLFRIIDQCNPELAKQCFRFVKDELLDRGETELFCRYADGLAAYLRSEIERFGEFKVHLQARPHVSADVLQRFESRLADTTLKLADIATAQGDFTMAGYLKKMAAKVCDDPRLQ